MSSTPVAPVEAAHSSSSTSCDLAHHLGRADASAQHLSPVKSASSDSDAAAVDMLSSPLITGSRGSVPVSSPSMSKLPGLQYAISHRRTDLRLPSFTMAYDHASSTSALSPTAAAAALAAQNSSSSSLHLSPAHCETPHFIPGVAAFCPETSPTDKTPASAAAVSALATATTTATAAAADDELARRKKGTRRGTLNPEAKNVLKAWMFSPEHFAHPYPSEEEKEELATEAGIEVKQLSNWFTNARKRLWQPVLRQSGVEVKNFLSTGRGGPRGNKLDVPVNLQQLVPPSPPQSPLRHRSNSSSASSETSSLSSPLKRTWSDVEASLPAAERAKTESSARAAAPKRKKTTASSSRKKSASRKDSDANATKVAHQLSHELRLALAERAASSASSSPVALEPQHDAAFEDLEILAATSLIGLHQQQYQPVH